MNCSALGHQDSKNIVSIALYCCLKEVNASRETSIGGLLGQSPGIGHVSWHLPGHFALDWGIDFSLLYS